MFSRRTAWSTTPSPFSAALDRLRARAPLLDLTVSDPTRVGFDHPPELYRALIDDRSPIYEPDALGLPVAREAIAARHRARGDQLDAAQICLTASTSEAYAYLLALLCDPGDQVMLPRPGYPLLRYLADLSAARLTAYPLAYDVAWHIDLPALRRALEAAPRARALVVIAPSNPCGNYLDPDQLEQLDHICAARDLALIIDEVFYDYPQGAAQPPPSPLATPRRALTFVISGLSKVAALPQLKLAWTIVAGPAELRDRALARLELIADAHLSPSTLVQRAAPRLLAAAPALQARILTRTRNNLAHLRERLHGSAVTLLTVEAGWTALLRLPGVDDLDDAAWALHLAAEHRTLLQPGFFYDLQGVHLALSLITPEPDIIEGTRRLLTAVAAHL
jgi:alanine-synthesizing transaminase